MATPKMGRDSTRLPLVKPHAREHTYCAFCPKLCRHTCPVSTAEGRETTTPWGKMTSLHHVDVGALPMHETYATTWFACTGCLRCKTRCAHGNEVASALGAGRAEAVKAGV
ncbi:MAG: (Fe-S)-binding protein, partial [Myxococcales bacterium]|nr:(Fe-S)-binding protein [Myxococcales bacterium]